MNKKDEQRIQQYLDEDLQLAQVKKVIYLEGKTDVAPFFGLLGLAVPNFGLHQGVLVKDVGGRTEVVNRVTAAANLSGPVYRGIYGLIDGDGAPLGTLAAQFDHPYLGPLFTWKAYCIENLLAKTGWPTPWGPELDWPSELKSYGPYVALNRIVNDLRSNLKVAGLGRLTDPQDDQVLKTSHDVITELTTGKDLIVNFDVVQRFQDELQLFETAVDLNVDEAHALLKGNWLIGHLAYRRTRKPYDQCRDEWIDHARTVGGLAEVRELWERITGSPP